MKIEIDILSNPKRFVNEWSKLYDYGMEDVYSSNIDLGLKNYKSFFDLYRWKNGVYNISTKKTRVIEEFWNKRKTLKELQNSFDWTLFENEFKPEKSSCIWKIFLLHIISPTNFPIFDVHVYRFHHFITNNKIKEIPNNQQSKYNYYKNEYFPWFNSIRENEGLNPKKMDESFFKMGQVLKSLKDVPFIIK